VVATKLTNHKTVLDVVKLRHHTPDKCPALCFISHKCQNKGHYTTILPEKSHCLKNSIATVAQAVECSESEDGTFGSTEIKIKTDWQTNVCFQGKDKKSEVTIISDTHSI